MSKERPEQSAELSPEVIAGYAETFIPRYDCYSQQMRDGSYRAIKHALTHPMIEAHMRGNITLGAYALDAQNRAKWLCLDADDENDWQGVLTIAQQLHDSTIPAYIEPSRRGGHLWLFFEPIAGKDIRRYGKWLLTEHGLNTVELYPKQDELRTGAGSLVRLPLGIHKKSNKRYYFVTLDGEPLAPSIREQMRVLVAPKLVPHKHIRRILKTLPEPKPVFPTPKFTKRGKVTGDTPSERIKNRVSVRDFVSQYVDLDRNWRGLCPFHDDHKQSFSVDERGNYWRCFAGCEGNTVIDFWMQWRKLNGQDDSFKETITELAEMLLPPL